MNKHYLEVLKLTLSAFCIENNGWFAESILQNTTFHITSTKISWKKLASSTEFEVNRTLLMTIFFKKKYI